MASQAMNATLRLSQRASTRKISHVLSGNTRSLSSTSSSAARACAARNVAFAVNTRLFSAIRTYSTQPLSESAELHESATQQEPQEQEQQRNRTRRAPDGKAILPNQTIFVTGLPFFTTEQDLREVFADSGNIRKIVINSPRFATQHPYAFITMSSLDESTAIVQGAAQEPFFLGDRELVINWARTRLPPPTSSIFFNNFRGGDLSALRSFLGENAINVNNAWFGLDQATREFKPSGMIFCRSVEAATQIIQELNGKPGPDGTPVSLRYGKDEVEVKNRERRQQRRQEALPVLEGQGEKEQEQQ